MIGSKLAHYEITQHLGSGGMGDVYQAIDAKLGRSVAIKLLPENFARDTERVGRLQREARVLASLNHPNIAAIHGIEEVDGRHFLVLEMVSGETLADRIQRGPIPIDEALAIAAQIAEALESAHEAGIVHRDLKPANVKVTPDGKVKVLDFGLAKAYAANEQESSLSSATMSLAATQRGMILGTAAYMSPEQARGQPVDSRADIWAFGVVLHEMVTGERLFKGEDLTDTLAAVVREKPDVSGAPLAVRRILQKCLEKDPRKRLRHISGFTLLIENPVPAPAAAIPMQVRARSTWVAWTMAAAAAIGLAALAFVHFQETAPELQAVQFSMEAPPDTNLSNHYGAVAPSPDGRYVVFAAQPRGGVQSLWLRPLDSMAMRPLPGTEGGNFPTWSHDSKSLVFLANAKLKRIEIAGGAPLTLGDASEDPVTATGSWNPAGVILFGSAAGLKRVSASGGGATLLTKVDPARKESGHGYPQFLPGNDRFLYFVASGDPNVQGIYASSLADPEKSQQILRTAAKAVFVPARGAGKGHLLWMQDQTLLAQHFDPDNLRLEGDPVSVQEGIGLNPNVNLRAAFWASDSGLLTFFAQPSSRKRSVVWINRDGKNGGEAAPQDAFSRVALAPGGDRIAVARIESKSGQANLDIWVRELARGVMTRLTFDAASDDLPAWSPDGKQIAFSSTRDGGVSQIYRKDASGAGQEERLTDGPNSKLLLDWSKDGKYILYRELNPQTGRDLMAVPLTGVRKPIPVVNTPFNEDTGAISPDSQWVAYASNLSGTNEIFVQAFPGVAGAPASRWQISNGGGYEVKWRIDGKEIYYESMDGKVMAAAVQAGPQGIRAEPPRVLFSAGFQPFTIHEFDAAPDGQRFLLILNSLAEGNVERLTVVSNWQATLRK